MTGLQLPDKELKPNPKMRRVVEELRGMLQAAKQREA
jgi:hypothetical protein